MMKLVPLYVTNRPILWFRGHLIDNQKALWPCKIRFNRSRVFSVQPLLPITCHGLTRNCKNYLCYAGKLSLLHSMSEQQSAFAPVFVGMKAKRNYFYTFSQKKVVGFLCRVRRVLRWYHCTASYSTASNNAM